MTNIQIGLFKLNKKFMLLSAIFSKTLLEGEETKIRAKETKEKIRADEGKKYTFK